jgi:hypothetical protein
LSEQDAKAAASPAIVIILVMSFILVFLNNTLDLAKFVLKNKDTIFF